MKLSSFIKEVLFFAPWVFVMAFLVVILDVFRKMDSYFASALGENIPLQLLIFLLTIVVGVYFQIRCRKKIQPLGQRLFLSFAYILYVSSFLFLLGLHVLPNDFKWLSIDLLVVNVFMCFNILLLGSRFFKDQT